MVAADPDRTSRPCTRFAEIVTSASTALDPVCSVIPVALF
jgi:hypothetical protein